MKDLKAKTITTDYLNIKELGAHIGDELYLETPTMIDRILFHPIYNPSEPIRIACWYFIVSTIIALISLTLSIHSCIK